MAAITAVVLTPDTKAGREAEYMKGRPCITLNELKKAFKMSRSAYLELARLALDPAYTIIQIRDVTLICTRQGAAQLLAHMADLLAQASEGAKTEYVPIRIRTIGRHLSQRAGIEHVVASRLFSTMLAGCIKHKSKSKLVRLTCPVRYLREVAKRLEEISTALKWAWPQNTQEASAGPLYTNLNNNK